MTTTTKTNELATVLTSNKEKIELLLAGSPVNPNQFLAIASRVIGENLIGCTPESVKKSVLSVATLGLSPDPTLGNAYILPYDSKAGKIAQLIIGYKGYIVLARRAGYEVLQYGAIHENDIFEDAPAGEAPRYSKARTNRGSLQGAFCVVRALNTKTITYTVLWEEEIARAKKSSKSSSSDYSPWKTSPDEMYVKTALRYHLSRLPLADKWKEIIAGDDEQEFEKPINDSPIIAQLKAKLEVIRGSEFEEAEIESLRSEFEENKERISAEDYTKALELLK